MRADRLNRVWTHETQSNEIKLSIRSDTFPTPKLTWGKPVDGLIAALEIRTPPDSTDRAHKAPGVVAGTGLASIVHLKNVTDKPITLISETGRQGDSLSVTNEQGEAVTVSDGFFTGWPIDVAWRLLPGETAQLDLLSPQLQLSLIHI